MLKDSEPEDLARAIRTVHAGDTIIAPELAQKMLNTFQSADPRDSRLAPPLTERELEVIRALAQGMSDRQIARSLSISEKTVRNHTSSIYRKLHIFDRTQAVIYAVREGVIDVEELDYLSSLGNPHRNLRARPAALYLDLPTQTSTLSLIAERPDTRTIRRSIEPLTVVGHLYHDRFVIRPQRYLGVSCLWSWSICPRGFRVQG